MRLWAFTAAAETGRWQGLSVDHFFELKAESKMKMKSEEEGGIGWDATCTFVVVVVYMRAGC